MFLKRNVGGVCTGCRSADRADDHERRGDHTLDDTLVLPLPDECPHALVDTERRERREHTGTIHQIVFSNSSSYRDGTDATSNLSR